MPFDPKRGNVAAQDILPRIKCLYVQKRSEAVKTFCPRHMLYKIHKEDDIVMLIFRLFSREIVSIACVAGGISGASAFW